MKRLLSGLGMYDGMISGADTDTVSPRKAGLPQFLGALSRVERALVEMNATNLRSNQKAASEFTNLLATGSSQIQEIFRATLQESAAPIEPLHYITKRTASPLRGR